MTDNRCPQCGADRWTEQDQPSPLQSVITWVPVDERLPDEGMNVLIAFSEDVGKPLRVWFGFHVEGYWFLDDGPDPDRIENVRFWAHRPHPSSDDEDSIR